MPQSGKQTEINVAQKRELKPRLNDDHEGMHYVATIKQVWTFKST